MMETKEKNQHTYYRRYYQRRKKEGWRTFSYVLPEPVHAQLLTLKNELFEQWRLTNKA